MLTIEITTAAKNDNLGIQAVLVMCEGLVIRKRIESSRMIGVLNLAELFIH